MDETLDSDIVPPSVPDETLELLRNDSWTAAALDQATLPDDGAEEHIDVFAALPQFIKSPARTSQTMHTGRTTDSESDFEPSLVEVGAGVEKQSVEAAANKEAGEEDATTTIKMEIEEKTSIGQSIDPYLAILGSDPSPMAHESRQTTENRSSFKAHETRLSEALHEDDDDVFNADTDIEGSQEAEGLKDAWFQKWKKEDTGSGQQPLSSTKPATPKRAKASRDASAEQKTGCLSVKEEPKKAPQRLLVLVGLVCSGKSTLAEAIVREGAKADGTQWIRVCQDVLKSRDKCVKLARTSLRDGHSVIIDRTNLTPQQVCLCPVFNRSYPHREGIGVS